jgi:hypothetical protein
MYIRSYTHPIHRLPELQTVNSNISPLKKEMLRTLYLIKFDFASILTKN